MLWCTYCLYFQDVADALLLFVAWYWIFCTEIGGICLKIYWLHGERYSYSIFITVIALFLVWQKFKIFSDRIIGYYSNCWLIFRLSGSHLILKHGGVIMTSSNGKIFCVTGPLWGEVTVHRWIPFTKASDAELWCFLWSAPGQTFEQTIETPLIWGVIVPIMTSL